ncbi:hypothetical protein FOL47_001190 [Perkinsus chesapeaki]|uniref:Uncharacterized protein n=1 Tax=Perkinsus chesapeaki TaxID=330153 RepID=A0A7J6MK56_PERCH|nr:hypothetical protein FOL47_001190 [Perkinsus chesapeaki]
MPSSPTSPELHECNGNYGKAQRALRTYSTLSARKLTVWFAIWFVASCILGCPSPWYIPAGVYTGDFSGNTIHMNVPQEAEAETAYMMDLIFQTKKGMFFCQPAECQITVRTRCTLVKTCTTKLHKYTGLSPGYFDFFQDGKKYFVEFQDGPRFEVKRVE